MKLQYSQYETPEVIQVYFPAGFPLHMLYLLSIQCFAWLPQAFLH